MDKSLVGHSLLALVSTVAAYVAWSEPNITEKDDAVVIFGDKADKLTEVEWQDEAGKVTVVREGDNLSITTVKAAPAPTAPAAPQTYPGTEQAKDVLKKLAPLHGARNLGLLAADKLKEFGLEAPKTKLVLHFGDETRSLDIGSTAFGSGDYYTRVQDGTTYLVRAATLSALGHGAIAMQDKDAVGLPRSKFNAVRISTADKKRELKQRNGDDPQKVFFSDPAEPDKRLDTMSGWMDRVLRLRVVELAAESPSGEPQLTVEFLKDSDVLATLKVWPATDKGAVAVSSHFKAPVVLFKGAIDAVLRDADNALGDGKS